MTRGTQVSVTPGVLNPGPGGHKILGFNDPGDPGLSDPRGIESWTRGS